MMVEKEYCEYLESLCSFECSEHDQERMRKHLEAMMQQIAALDDLPCYPQRLATLPSEESQEASSLSFEDLSHNAPSLQERWITTYRITHY